MKNWTWLWAVMGSKLLLGITYVLPHTAIEGLGLSLYVTIDVKWNKLKPLFSNKPSSTFIIVKYMM